MCLECGIMHEQVSQIEYQVGKLAQQHCLSTLASWPCICVTSCLTLLAPQLELMLQQCLLHDERLSPQTELMLILWIVSFFTRHLITIMKKKKKTLTQAHQRKDFRAELTQTNLSSILHNTIVSNTDANKTCVWSIEEPECAQIPTHSRGWIGILLVLIEGKSVFFNDMIPDVLTTLQAKPHPQEQLSNRK